MGPMPHCPFFCRGFLEVVRMTSRKIAMSDNSRQLTCDINCQARKYCLVSNTRLGHYPAGRGYCTNRRQPVSSTSRAVSPTLQSTSISQSNSGTWRKKSMRVNSNFGKIVMLATALVLMSFTLSFAKPSVDYRFKVHNNTKQAIKKIKVSDDGKKWGYFDIGDGIAAGATEELIWDKSTDNGACEWKFKAVFADGEESEAVEFNL